MKKLKKKKASSSKLQASRHLTELGLASPERAGGPTSHKPQA